jgi:predicted lipoprotein with Yx(FWY)xxD motif
VTTPREAKTASPAQPTSGRAVKGRGDEMKHWIKLFGVLAASAVFVATAAAFAFANGTNAGGTTIAIAKTRLGRILVDSKGITLYDFVTDKHGVSGCYGACAALWPPLITKGKPHAGLGLRASLLGTTKRKDGKLEVTYNGHPLYYFVTDRKPGQTTGQGVNQFGGPWWVLSPAGKEIHRG